MAQPTATESNVQEPSIRELARLAGTSKTTAARVLAALRRAGSIGPASKNQHSGREPGPQTAISAHDKLTWQKARSLVEKELCAGGLGLRGMLPRIKEMQIRYGVCYRTMRAILLALEKDGLIVSRGKQFALAESRLHHDRQSVVFITTKDHYSQASALNQSKSSIVNLFENECLRLGIALKTVEIDFYDTTAVWNALAGLDNAEGTIGYIIDVWWYPTRRFQDSYLHIVDRVSVYKKPVAILDEIGSFELPHTHESNPLIQVFRIESTAAGERMARHLLALGHKEVAFISSIHQARWSQQRCEGVAAQFKRVGNGSKVHLCTQEYELPLEHVLAASQLSDKDVKAIIAMGRTPSQAKALEEEWRARKERKPGAITSYQAINTDINRSLNALVALLSTGLSKETIDRAGNSLLDVVGLRVFESSLRPLYEKALKLSGVTAWICVTDWSGFLALDFLRARKISIPDRLAVVGFDNVPVEALKRGFTTYDFNATGFVTGILGFILRPPRPRRAYRHKAIEVEGFVVERKTTRKLPA